MKTVKNPKVNLDKLIVTYHYRIKDSNKKLVKSLMHKSGLVNLVWNYCNDIQQQAVKRCRPWLSAFDLSNLTSGTSKEIDLHSASIQAVCEEYATRRSQFNKPFLKFRTNKKDRSLPWIPFKASAIKVDDKGTFSFMGLKLKTWYSREIDKRAVIKTGSINRDSCGKWFISVVCELKFSSKEEQENYQLSLTSKGQNLTAIDPGLNPMLTFSIEQPDGSIIYKEIEPQKYYKNLQDKLAKFQRAKKKKQTKILHKKIKNKRKDFNHKLANELIKDNYTIINTDLNIAKLKKGKLKGHAKAWSDIGLGELRVTLRTKAKKHNVKYIEVSESILKSTQTCSCCKAMTGPRGRKGLGVSSWACLKCGRHHERNQNSADNHRLAYKESLRDDSKILPKKELKNKVSLTILDKECLQRESPSL